jgi:hypothetical protein
MSECLNLPEAKLSGRLASARTVTPRTATLIASWTRPVEGPYGKINVGFWPYNDDAMERKMTCGPCSAGGIIRACLWSNHIHNIHYSHQWCGSAVRRRGVGAPLRLLQVRDVFQACRVVIEGAGRAPSPFSDCLLTRYFSKHASNAMSIFQSASLNHSSQARCGTALNLSRNLQCLNRGIVF